MDSITFSFPVEITGAEFDEIVSKAADDVMRLAAARLNPGDVVHAIRGRLLSRVSGNQAAALDNLPLPVLSTACVGVESRQEPLPFTLPELHPLAQNGLARLCDCLNRLQWHHADEKMRVGEFWYGLHSDSSLPVAYQRSSHPDRLFVIRAHPYLVDSQVFRPWRLLTQRLAEGGVIKPRGPGHPVRQICINGRTLYGLDFALDVLNRYGFRSGPVDFDL